MELIRTRQELPLLDRWRTHGDLVLVPTMGALHEGHLSLVELASRHGAVVVSIFVNPAQFTAGEDYEAYPQDLENDLQALARHDVAAVFAPDVATMYPGGLGVSEVTVQPGPRAGPLCGVRRAGHFAGVLTVVAKLFHLVRPDLAVFGRKDAQQCLVIEEMVQDLDFGIRLLDGPTLREADGLAMSSRNRYLSSTERKHALCLRRGLLRGRRLLQQGERQAAAVVVAMTEELRSADSVEYAELRSVPELEPVTRVFGKVLLAVAAKVGPARLIDNLVLEVREDNISSASLLGSEAEA